MGHDFVFTNIRLPEDLHRQLKTRAAREGISLAEIVRRAGKQYLLTLEEKQEQQDPQGLLADLRRDSLHFLQQRKRDWEEERTDLQAQREEFRSKQSHSGRQTQKLSLSEEIVRSRENERQ